MVAIVTTGDARSLPFPDESVDLIVTSPPYFGLRKYAPGVGEDVPIGEETSPQEFVAALVECTREFARVLKPSGSIFVNLGDKYTTRRTGPVPPKSLLLIPERYRIACTDELGLIARAVIVWAKPNGLPESVRDRVRRSHEDWVHLTKAPRYFEAVDEIREPTNLANETHARKYGGRYIDEARPGGSAGGNNYAGNPLGKLPGSVWTIATQPLRVPAELNVDHFAAFPMEWPRRLITGWCPREVCSACGEGRRRVNDGAWYFAEPSEDIGRRALDRARELGITAEEVGKVHGVKALGKSNQADESYRAQGGDLTERIGGSWSYAKMLRSLTKRALSGYACACPDTTAPSTPGVVLDPFGGTGTTALVADVLGRVGISLDASEDYGRIARWRTTDEKQRARAARDVSRPAATEPPALFAA